MTLDPCSAIIDGKPCPDSQMRRVLGYCLYHYRQHERGAAFTAHRVRRAPRSTLARDDMGRRQCGKCLSWLELDKFGGHRFSPDGLQAWCHACMADSALLTRYGLTRQEINALIVQQGGCAICRRTELNAKDARRSWHVDHDHACCPGDKTCGKCIRSILCARCNKMIGQAGDDITILRAAIDYLERHSAHEAH